MRLRWARLFNVPMDEQLPEGFPQNTLLVSTVIVLQAITLTAVDAESTLCVNSQISVEAGKDNCCSIPYFVRRAQGNS